MAISFEQSWGFVKTVRKDGERLKKQPRKLGPDASAGFCISAVDSVININVFF